MLRRSVANEPPKADDIATVAAAARALDGLETARERVVFEIPVQTDPATAGGTVGAYCGVYAGDLAVGALSGGEGCVRGGRLEGSGKEGRRDVLQCCGCGWSS